MLLAVGCGSADPLQLPQVIEAQTSTDAGDPYRGTPIEEISELVDQADRGDGPCLCSRFHFTFARVVDDMPKRIIRPREA